MLSPGSRGQWTYPSLPWEVACTPALLSGQRNPLFLLVQLDDHPSVPRQDGAESSLAQLGKSHAPGQVSARRGRNCHRSPASPPRPPQCLLSSSWGLCLCLSTLEPCSDSCLPCHRASLSFATCPVDLRHRPCLPHRAAMRITRNVTTQDSG